MHGRLSLLSLFSFLFGSLCVSACAFTSEDILRIQANSGMIYPSIATPGSDSLFSALVAELFYETAYDLAASSEAGTNEVEQAIVFLRAAMELDRNNPAFRPLLIDLASRNRGRDYSNLEYLLLTEYVDEFADLEIVEKAVEYILSQQETREDREKFLEQMLGNIAGKNTVLGSDLATMLGILKAEKPDLKAAEFYLIQAYKYNRYNKLAFVRLDEIAHEQIEPVLYLEHFRLALRENPVDIEAAIAFAQHAEQLQLYDVAASAYEYSAGLFAYLYPAEILSARIYIPWAISCYNSQRNQSKCLEIAELIRQKGKFDLRLEAIAGRAAIKLGKDELATQILQNAEQKAGQIVARNQKLGTGASADSQAGRLQQVDAVQMAWFYCFVIPLPQMALSWANNAFSSQQNSAAAASVMAYALVLNQEYETAKPLVKNFERNQISDLAQARIQIAEGQNALAIETLRNAIARDPGSFAAERAKDILTQQGQKYVPPVNPESVLGGLEKSFGGAIVPVFTRPEQIISVELSVPGNEFPYGSRFDGVIAITNNSSEPLVISDNGLFTGSIRIDADIVGDLRMKIPNLVSKKVRTTLLVGPGRSLLVPVKLYAGQLKDLLTSYPQASLDIQFTLFLDPVKTDSGQIANRLTYIIPAQVRVRRPGVNATSRLLSDRLNNLVLPGRLEEKILTAELFTGLLKEQNAFSTHAAPYNLTSTAGITDMLRTGLSHQNGLLLNPDQSQWEVKVFTLDDMLSLELDYNLMSAVSENLYDNRWPVRLMALYLLAENRESGFEKVLDWVAKNDTNKYVRDMAILLSGTLFEG